MKNIFFATGNSGKLDEARQIFANQAFVFGTKDFKHPFVYHDPIEDTDSFLANAFVKVISAAHFLKKNRKTLPVMDKIFVDDSGLCVPDFHFLPGVHSAVYAGEPRDDAQNRRKLREEIASFSLQNGTLFSSSEKRLPAFFVCFVLSFSLGEIDTLFSGFSTAQEDFNVSARFFLKENLKDFELTLLKSLACLRQDGKTAFALSVEIPLHLFGHRAEQSYAIDLHAGVCHGWVSTQEQNLVVGAGHGYDSLFYSRKNPELSFASLDLKEKNCQSHRSFALKAMKID